MKNGCAFSEVTKEVFDVAGSLSQSHVKITVIAAIIASIILNISEKGQTKQTFCIQILQKTIPPFCGIRMKRLYAPL